MSCCTLTILSAKLEEILPKKTSFYELDTKPTDYN